MEEINYGNIGRLLFTFEEEVFDKYRDKDIGSWNSWQILRRPLYYAILNEHYYRSQALFARPSSDNFRRLFVRIIPSLKFLSDLIKILAGKKRKNLTVLFAFAQDKMTKDEKGRSFNVLMDSLVSKGIIMNYIYMETSVNGDFKPPVAIKRDIETDGLLLPVALLKRVLGLFRFKKKLIKFYTNEINKFLKAQNIDYSVPPAFIKEIFMNFYSEYVIYRIFFSLVRPTWTIFGDGLATGKMAAAIKYGAKVLELQHGFAEKYKPDYVLSEKLNDIRRKLIIPTRLGLFGLFYKDIVTRTGFWKEEEIFLTGNLRMQQYRTLTRASNSGRPNILLPTQWHVFKETKDLISQILERMEYHYCLIIKVHPREPEEHKIYFKTLAEKYSGRVVYYDSGISIYQLIKDADLVIGFDSTTLLESVAMGVPSVTIPTSVFPEGIYGFLGEKTIISALRVEEAISIPILIHHFFNDTFFKNQWISDCKRLSAYIYADHYWDEEQIKTVFHV